MKILSVEELKVHFSEIIEQMRAGEALIISDDTKKENIAFIIPYRANKSKKIRLGLLQAKTYKIHDDFKMTAG